MVLLDSGMNIRLDFKCNDVTRVVGSLGMIPVAPCIHADLKLSPQHRNDAAAGIRLATADCNKKRVLH